MTTAKFKKGQTVKYLGHKAIIRSVNFAAEGSISYNVRYISALGKGTANFVHQNTITE